MATLKSRAKKAIRKRIKVHEKYVTRVARPIGAAAAGYFAGPVGAAAFTALTHPLHQYAATVSARSDGLSGREARTFGREHAKRTSIHSLAAGAAGAIGSGVTSALVGGNFFGGLAGGQGGAALLGGNTIFGAAGAAGSVTSAVTGGAATLSGVQFGWDSLARSDAEIQAAGGLPAPNPWADLLEGIGGALGAAGSSGEVAEDQEASRNPFAGFGMDAPTSKSEEGGWLVPALIVGGVLLLSA